MKNLLLKSLLVCFMAASSFVAQAQNAEKATQAFAAAPKTQPAKKVAVYVRNNSGKSVLDAKTKFLEFAIASRLNNMGFGVIDYDLVIRNLNTYLGNPNAKNRSALEKFKNSLKDTSIDAKLFEDASGLRIGELIGADYLLTVSYGSLGTDKRTYSGNGITTVNTIYNLRSNYNLAEAGGATGTAGGSVRATTAIRQAPDIMIENDDILDSMIEDTADQIASLLNNQNSSGQIIAKTENSADVSIICKIEEMTIPEILNNNGTYMLGTNTVAVTIPYVTATIDGVAQTMGGKINLSKGLHTLKISQADLEPLEANINVTGKPDQVLMFALKLNDAARKRWKNDMAFMEEMKARAMQSDNKRKLTDAEVERIKGIAQMYKNSGYNIKIDANNLPEVHQTQSIFGQ